MVSNVNVKPGLAFRIRISNQEDSFQNRSDQVGSLLKVLQGRLVVLRQVVAALAVHLRDENHKTGEKKPSSHSKLKTAEKFKIEAVQFQSSGWQYNAHLAQKSHGVGISCIGGLVEVVIRPLLDRKRHIIHQQGEKKKKKDLKTTISGGRDT